MASPSPSVLPWAWTLEALADFQPADSTLLCALMDKAPDISGDWFKSARERIALRGLREWMDTDLEVVNKELAEQEVGTSGGGSRAGIGMADSSEDVILKLVRLDAYGKHRAELKREVEQFIQQKRAIFPTSTLYQLKESGFTCFPPSGLSSGETFAIVRDDKACCIDNDNSCEEVQPVNKLKEYPEHDKIQLAKKNSGTSENGNGRFTSGEEVPLQNSTLEGELKKKNDLVVLEKSPVQQPSGNGDGMPQLAHPDGDIGATHQDPNRQNAVDDNNGNPTCSSFDDVATQKHKTFCQSQGSQSMLLSDWTEQVLCIKCEEGGQLLTCCSSACPIAVHENCLGSSLKLDESGKFYCPFCSYFRAHAVYHKAKRKVAVTKKALSAFMSGDLVNGCSTENLCVERPEELTEPRSHIQGKEASVDPVESTEPRLHIQGKEASVDLPCREGSHEEVDEPMGDRHNCHTIDERAEVGPPGIENNGSSVDHEHDIFQIKESNDIRDIADHEQAVQSMEPGVSLADGTVDSSLLRNGIEHVKVVCNNSKISNMEPEKETEQAMEGIIHDEIDDEGDNNFILKRRTRKRRRKESDQLSPVQQNRVNLRKPKLQINGKDRDEKDFSPSRLMKRRTPTKRYSNPCSPLGRRNKLRWTPEEEDALKELVPKFSDNCKKGIPWTEILENGGHIFHRTRTPIDLKDKWRNILKARER